ncbi:glycosyltransferase [Nostoc calcicola FACHB-3891]|nr:glycosyltransferase [Nostoc calcicola FACHB-3891]
MKAIPKVIILIPTYNQENFIRQCLNSALDQSYKNYEIWVVNDGSTDKTSEIIYEYENKIKIFSKPNGGTASCWNHVLKLIDSDYIIGLDSDDELNFFTLEKTVELALNNLEADVIYSDYEFIDYKGSTIKLVFNPEPIDPLNQLISLHNKLGEPNNFVPFGHVRLYKTKSLLKIGGYDENYLYAEDYELLLRMAKDNYKFVRVPEVLYRYRWHYTNKGILSRKEQIEEVRKSVYLLKQNFDI